MHPVGQDTDSTGLDLEGYSCVIFAVLPLVAYRTTFDQHPHAFVEQRLPVLGLGVPQLNWCPETTTVLVAFAGRYWVVEVDVEPQQTPRLGVVTGELAVVGGGADIAFTDEVSAQETSAAGLSLRC